MWVVEKEKGELKASYFALENISMVDFMLVRSSSSLYLILYYIFLIEICNFTFIKCANFGSIVIILE